MKKIRAKDVKAGDVIEIDGMKPHRIDVGYIMITPKGNVIIGEAFTMREWKVFPEQWVRSIKS